jgi:hypothetical protein
MANHNKSERGFANRSEKERREIASGADLTFATDLAAGSNKIRDNRCIR